MITIRPVRASDLDALYRVALETGDGGADASALYRDAKLLGHIYAAPYAVLSPETVFVAACGPVVVGYIVGASDTAAFEASLEATWWPTLRAVYPDPAEASRADWTLDQRRMRTIHHPPRTPCQITDVYPSHLHINLLPAARGEGVGQALVGRWLRTVQELRSTGVHLAVGVSNTRAIRFYELCGFREPHGLPSPTAGARWLALALPRPA